MLVIFEIGTAFQSRAQLVVFGCGCCNEQRNEICYDVVQFGSQGERGSDQGRFGRVFLDHKHAHALHTANIREAGADRCQELFGARN